jgi:acylphosphatase
MIHKKIWIFGRVQGVGFRYKARNMALSYGIKGYVKNMPDGSVYIETEGPEKNILEFIKWCRKGPDFAFVDHINIEDASLENYQTFDIRF